MLYAVLLHYLTYRHLFLTLGHNRYLFLACHRLNFLRRTLRLFGVQLLD